MAIKDEKVLAVAMYKDKEGRKLIAIGTDGSQEAKKKIAEIMRNDLDRSYGGNFKSCIGHFSKNCARKYCEAVYQDSSRGEENSKR